jgi:hypothetical protein
MNIDQFPDAATAVIHAEHQDTNFTTSLASQDVERLENYKGRPSPSRASAAPCRNTGELHSNITFGCQHNSLVA